MERDEALQSLLVQLAKLQVVLRRVTAERDTLKTELAEQASSQQQCLQLLLDARQQLQIFQIDICRVRDSNDQLAAHNHRLQQQVQQLQSHTQQLQQQQQQLDSKQHMFQQSCEQQEWPAQHAEELSRMALLSHLASTWHNRTDSAHGDSSSSRRTSVTSSTSGSADTSDSGLLRGSKDLHESQAGKGNSTTSMPHMDMLCHTTQSHGQQLQQDQQHQLQQLLPEGQPYHAHEDAVQDTELQQGVSSCSLPGHAEGLPVVQPARVFGPGQPTPAALVLQPVELATAVRPMQLQWAEASTTAAGTALDGVVHITQQQLDYIMTEVEQLQQKLAQTTAKLDAAVDQPITSQLLLQQEAVTQQDHHPQQQGSCVSLQTGDQPISAWHQQLKHKQQQLQQRQQQVLGLQQSTQQQPQQQQQKLQGSKHEHRQCMAANIRRSNQQQQHHRQQQHHQHQQHQLCELLTPRSHSSKPSWNYQNPQTQQEQRQRRQRQRDAVRLRALVPPHLHQEHTTAELQCMRENQPRPLQQLQQRQQGQQAGLQDCTHQQQHKQDPQGSGGSVTAAAIAGNIDTETLETIPTADAASSCLQPEGSWVSSASSSGQPAAAADADAGPETVALDLSQPGGRRAAVLPAETVVFMQPICVKSPGVVHKLNG